MIRNVVKFVAALSLVIGMVGIAVGLGLVVTFCFLAADEPGTSHRLVNLVGASIMLVIISAIVVALSTWLFVNRTIIEKEVEKG